LERRTGTSFLREVTLAHPARVTLVSPYTSCRLTEAFPGFCPTGTLRASNFVLGTKISRSSLRKLRFVLETGGL